ncbi:hypothetical protein CRG98_031482 [Punica granatum]|uniref:Uncharacterized protein n=1 Tax=Punica granatum TaxID=22663 RepID=A0A2I0IWS5_PUNGR|nr:hypothetical protein CRG98_031482 [Punica granatum]
MEGCAHDTLETCLGMPGTRLVERKLVLISFAWECRSSLKPGLVLPWRRVKTASGLPAKVGTTPWRECVGVCSELTWVSEFLILLIYLSAKTISLDFGAGEPTKVFVLEEEDVLVGVPTSVYEGSMGSSSATG